MDLKDVKARGIIRKQCVAPYPFGIREDGVWKEGQFKGYETL